MAIITHNISRNEASNETTINVVLAGFVNARLTFNGQLSAEENAKIVKALKDVSNTVFHGVAASDSATAFKPVPFDSILPKPR